MSTPFALDNQKNDMPILLIFKLYVAFHKCHLLRANVINHCYVPFAILQMRKIFF